MGTVCAACGAPSHEGPCPFDRTITHDPNQPRLDSIGELAPFAPVDEAHYAIQGEHARGGLGRILLARDRRLARPVALKELLRRSADNEARFLHEAIVTAQLQHPGVVPIYEAGRWPSGDPFYSMKLISGRSLGELIRSARALPERLALLPNVVAAAEAVAYAHNQGIIHRDLKPANIMVGEFGETVVVDWGLAKRRGAADSERAGTAQYMPPEQARGVTDERSDVYALGALLYHLLAGEPPYDGDSSEEVLAQLESGAPLPLATRQPEVPVELTAIVDKAMARAPEARYPSARELAADLKRFQTGQLVSSHRYSTSELVRRWLLRHRLPVAVAAIAMVVLLVMGTFSVRRIVAERDRADRQRAAAEELVQFMLTDLKRQLKPVGRLDILDGVGGRVEAYYRALEGVGGSDPASLRRRARGLAAIGEVEQARGRLPQAIAAFARGIEIERRLFQSDEVLVDIAEMASGKSMAETESGEPKLGLETVAEALGRVRGRPRLGYSEALLLNARERVEEYAGKPKEAVPSMLEALTALDRAPASSDALRLRLKLLARLGGVSISLGDFEEGKKRLTECVRRAEEILGSAPNDPSFQDGVVDCRWQEANLYEHEGNFDQALAALAKVMAVREPRGARDPGNLIWQEALADALDYRADLYKSKVQPVPAQADAERALGIIDHLLAFDGSNVRWTVNGLNALWTLGDLDNLRNDRTAALKHYRAGLARAVGLAARDRNNTDWQRREATFHNMIGSTLILRKEFDEGIRELSASLEIGKRIVALSPKNDDYGFSLADDYLSVGDAELARGHLDAALASYRGGLGIMEPMIERDKTGWIQAAETGRAWAGVGNVQLAQKKEARASFQRAVELMAPFEKKLDAGYGEVYRKAQKHLK
jgi:tetratricopeptide (TPR) repeat protein/tRNA A-37 threonylcarbamoyl transferase component Bud32